MEANTARVMAGNPSTNKSLYRLVRFMVHDAMIAIDLPDGSRSLILREIEMDRAKKHARADRVYGYSDFAPKSGLSGDRDIAAAQSTAECLKRNGITTVVADRTLPLLYVDEMQAAGIHGCYRSQSERRGRNRPSQTRSKDHGRGHENGM